MGNRMHPKKTKSLDEAGKKSICSFQRTSLPFGIVIGGRGRGRCCPHKQFAFSWEAPETTTAPVDARTTTWVTVCRLRWKPWLDYVWNPPKKAIQDKQTTDPHPWWRKNINKQSKIR
uniref:Uncharacterized protein n=1 Tax=Panagrellus redivivus TaxID=6233 RepID=A0A7E4VX31_PANRE